MNDWFAQEQFWRELAPYIFNAERWAAADPEVRDLLRLTGKRRGRALDLCCGPGRHALALARRGWDVTGVDRTACLLRQARTRARRAGLALELVQADMRSFVRAAAFDLVLSLYTSFGYFAQPDEDCRVLANILQSLKPNGCLVMDVLGKERLAQTFTPATVADFGDGTLLVQRQQVTDGWTRLRHEWLLIRGERVRRFHFEHALYSGQELRDRLLGAGFAQVALHGGFAGEPYGPAMPRLVIVARKAASRG